MVSKGLLTVQLAARVPDVFILRVTPISEMKDWSVSKVDGFCSGILAGVQVYIHLPSLETTDGVVLHTTPYGTYYST